jgi:hypothetical protein
MRTSWGLRRVGLFTVVLTVGVVLAVGNSSCVANLSRRAHLARVDLAGLSRSELLACAGEPVRVQHAGEWEYLTYISPLPTKRENADQCVATFMVRAGYVDGLDYETASGGLIGKSIPECLSIVDPCLALRKN